MKKLRRICLVFGVVSAAAVPALFVGTAHAVQAGTESCYVEVDDGGVGVTFGGSQAPYVGVSRSGTAGAGVHCPLDDLAPTEILDQLIQTPAMTDPAELVDKLIEKPGIKPTIWRP
ncbi:MAG TPA: hypothetical protein VE174_12445 [Actinomycetota bacterium]|nr:hypothetical protein [Actinomycetota bacterium]